jgi:hypothetical protein
LKSQAAITRPILERDTEIVASPSMDRVREYIRASKAQSTLLGYQSDWRHFIKWCQVHDIGALPASPENVASYIAECAGRLKTGTIQRRLNAIAEAHKAIGLDTPTSAGIVRNTLKGIKRTIGTAAVSRATFLRTPPLFTKVAVGRDGKIGSWMEPNVETLTKYHLPPNLNVNK